MYLGISFENLITVGVMLAAWMLVLHLLGQAGVQVSKLWGGS